MKMFSFSRKAQPAAPLWDSSYELLVSLELDNPPGTRYRRPYVAVWAEDADGYPVRTMSLWVQAHQPGPRWIPNLRRWFRSDRMRQLADHTDLVTTISSSTRQSGKYSLIWDGKDDQKKKVPQGKYTLYIEVAREHGTYQVITKKLDIGTKPFQANLGGNPEVKSASLEFRRRPSKA